MRAEAIGQAGFTLVEVLISLLIFSLIGVAGFVLIENILRVHQRTEDRLASLGDRERMMHLLTLDAGQAGGDRLAVAEGGLIIGGMTGTDVAYSVQDGALVRTVGGRQQMLLEGVDNVEAEAFLPGTGWTGDWRPDAGAGAAPSAVRLTIEFDTGERLSRTVRNAAPAF